MSSPACFIFSSICRFSSSCFLRESMAPLPGALARPELVDHALACVVSVLVLRSRPHSLPSPPSFVVLLRSLVFPCLVPSLSVVASSCPVSLHPLCASSCLLNFVGPAAAAAAFAAGFAASAAASQSPLPTSTAAFPAAVAVAFASVELGAKILDDVMQSEAVR